jgi:Nif-specific ferredoxin III
MSKPITGVTAGGAVWTPAFVQAIAQERCIGCGRCFKVCPRDVFDLVDRADVLYAD